MVKMIEKKKLIRILLGPQVFIMIAFALLIYTSILLLDKQVDYANEIASRSYVLIAIGIAYQFIRLFFKEQKTNEISS